MQVVADENRPRLGPNPQSMSFTKYEVGRDKMCLSNAFSILELNSLDGEKLPCLLIYILHMQETQFGSLESAQDENTQMRL